jgi:ATP-GRASP peptide maturase of grasp-with-spasm system
MIFIAGQTNENITTIEIQDWMDNMGVNYKKILPPDFMLKTMPVLTDKDAVWVYKGVSEMRVRHGNRVLSSFLSDEIKVLYENAIHDAVQYPNIEVGNLNKLTVINKAKKLKIHTPNTLVSNSKNDLLDFFILNNKSIITKTIGEVEAFDFEDRSYALFTEVITDEKIEKLPNVFFPSLFQQMIEKSYEIRSFYIDGDFYSMAIFSGSDQKTKVDFRKYNQTKPNRTVPYQLPSNLELKLHKLMLELGLNTGSIDLIKSIDNKYYFLEVNPVGQFGMVSKPCNYFLEKIVANKLKKYE